MSSHAVPIREGVVVLEERHSLEDLKNVVKCDFMRCYLCQYSKDKVSSEYLHK